MSETSENSKPSRSGPASPTARMKKKVFGLNKLKSTSVDTPTFDEIAFAILSEDTTADALQLETAKHTWFSKNLANDKNGRRNGGIYTGDPDNVGRAPLATDLFHGGDGSWWDRWLLATPPDSKRRMSVDYYEPRDGPKNTLGPVTEDYSGGYLERPGIDTNNSRPDDEVGVGGREEGAAPRKPLWRPMNVPVPMI